MAMVLYNTLTNKKEVFKSIEENVVKMYVCGPTVYSFLHIGNFRGPVFYNFLRNRLENLGYRVTYVFNYTDVDDKIIKTANELGITQSEHAENYIKEFEKDFSALELTSHDHNPRVTEHMDGIISIISKLVENNKAYVIDGEVFYSTKEFETYGKLSGKNLDQLEAGNRVEVDTRKKHPSDFVLWKPAKSGEPFWSSPWSDGRPGWHIECTAMIHALLGDQIDIHGGGIDLIFPHHENEIAQGEGAYCTKYCNYWVHNEFINIDDQKMSKSIGNVITGRDFMEKYHPEILKYVFLTAHYRSVININSDKIHASFGGLERVYKCLDDVDFILKNTATENIKEDAKVFKKLDQAMTTATSKIKKALDDDLNTPEMFAQIFSVIRVFNEQNIIKKLKDPSSFVSAKLFKDWITPYSKMLSLFNQPPKEFLKTLDDIVLKIKNISRSEIDGLIEKRNDARSSKDFEKSDLYRDQLNELGVIILDSTEGTTWTIDKSKF